jgi:hypothetical protein
LRWFSCSLGSPVMHALYGLIFALFLIVLSREKVYLADIIRFLCF